MGVFGIVASIVVVMATETVVSASGAAVEKETVLLAIDDVSLPLKRNVCYYISKPQVHKEPVLAPNRDDQNSPDQVAAQCYGTVLLDGGRFRMWYYGKYYAAPNKPTQGPICYAESDDGIHWTRPKLGQVEIKGRRDNNAIALPGDMTQAALVIKDDQESDLGRRYKMLYNTNNGQTWVFRTATSADGIQWKAGKNFATDRFLELSSFYKHNGLYIVNGQGLTRGEGGSDQGRQGYARVSVDFDNWLGEEAEAFALPEPANPADRGVTKPYDQVHLGVGAKSLGNVAIGLYGQWHNQPGEPARDIPWAWFGYGKTSCDLGLVISNDGLHFREPVKGLVFLSRLDSPSPPIGQTSFPTVLCQSGNAILNVGDETRIYHGRWRNGTYGTEPWEEIALATLPRDRWGGLGLHPNEENGTIWSTPITLPNGGCDVALNADDADGLRIELADDQFKLLSEFSGDKGGAARTNSGLKLPVRWNGSDLRELGGRTVRLKIRFDKKKSANPMLYAIYLQSRD